MARALMTALGRRGRKVELASRLRSFDRQGDSVRQRRMQHIGERVAARLIRRYRNASPVKRPEAWITYHAYHKSPDWVGPIVRRALGIPYLLIEASFAGKQAYGPWDLGHRATEAAVRTAEITFAMTAVDEAGLAPLITPPGEVRRLPPFLDPAPYRQAYRERARARRDLADRFGLDIGQPLLLTVGMMRDDVKRQSYQILAETLRKLGGWPWQLLIVGDGPARAMVENLFLEFGSGRVKFAGILGETELPACYAAADVYAWPAVQEAYGMALLEAQASGLPVVAGREGGVADVVRDGVTGKLTAARSPDALASGLAELLDQPHAREAMSAAAVSFVEEEHSLDRAASLLERALSDAAAILGARNQHRAALP